MKYNEKSPTEGGINFYSLFPPVDISSKILGPIHNEIEFAKIISQIYPVCLVMGISAGNFRLRKKFILKYFSDGGQGLNVLFLPLIDKKLLRLFSCLLFALTSAVIFTILKIQLGLKAIIVRTSSSTAVLSLPAKCFKTLLIYRAISTPFTRFESNTSELGGITSKIHAAVMRVLDLSALIGCDYIAVTSPVAGDLILNELSIKAEKIVLLPYHIPDYLKCVTPEERNFDEITLIYFGSLNVYYDFDNLLNAMRTLVDEGLKINLMIYGTGPKRANLLKMINSLNLQDNVTIKKMVSRQEIPNIAKDAFASVIPYSEIVQHGVSLKSIESMALGLPVIISKPADSIYRNKENCLILKEDSIGGWLNAIRELTDIAVWRKLRVGGLQTATMFRKGYIVSTINSLVDKGGNNAVNTIEQMNNALLEKIEKKELRLAVIGLGYVGLPTAALFAKAGFFVTALDIKEDLIQALNTGIVSINEPGLTELISINISEGRLNPQLISDTALSGNDVFIITVQTPVDIENKPNLTYLLTAIRSIGKILRKGNAVVICSTIPPGTLKGPVKEILESLSGLRADIDFYLAYVPERIAPGKALDEFVTGSRLVGGIGSNSTSIVAAIFKAVCKKTLEIDAITAEIAKCAENTFRDVNIAFANQLALICERHGSDVVKVIDLANTHPRVNIHLSGPGVGGPCLTKDPYLLTQGMNFDNNIILTARKINDYMPYHVVDLVIGALKSCGKEISKTKISVLGTAYKANVDDARCSPAEVVIKKLLELGANIFAYDPYCSNTFGAVNAKSLNAAVECSDCLIIMTDHSEFRGIELQNIKLLMNSSPILIDTRRIFEPLEVEKNGFIYRGIGYSKKPEDCTDSSLTDCPRTLLR